MNLKPDFNLGFLFFLLSFTISYCTQPKEPREASSDNVLEETTPILGALEGLEVTEADSLVDVRKFLGESTYRLIEIGHSLAQINREINSERSNFTLGVGGEVFQLNKKHLELKSKVRQSINYTRASWLEFEVVLPAELDMLEESISDFIESRGRN